MSIQQAFDYREAYTRPWLNLLSMFQQPGFMSGFIFSFSWSAAILLVRFALVRAIRQSTQLTADVKRRWIVNVRNGAVTLMLVGLMFIWADEVKTFTISLLAIGAAVAIVLKEFFQSLIAGLMRTGSKSYSIGDRIEINGIRGDVIDHDLFRTTLLEVGPGNNSHQFTGRTIFIPNSKFVTEFMINETRMGRYVLHIFKIPMLRTDDWKAARIKLREICMEVCADITDKANQQFIKMGRRDGIDVPNATPRITIFYPDPARIDLIVRIPALPSRKGKLEQDIISRFEGIDTVQ